MKIIAIIAQKGGVGKTTLTLSLAVAAQKSGLETLVLDLDPQASATTWYDRREEQPPLVMPAQPARLARVLQTAQDNGAQLVFIDTPPRVEQAAMGAARVASLVLIPCRPAVIDIDTVASTVELIRLAGHRGGVAVILNGVPATGSDRQQAADVIHDAGLMVCPSAIGYRKAFPHSIAVGQTVQEYEPTGKAADEIGLVFSFVRQLLN